MTLKLHNTLTGKLDEFKPINDGRVLIYTCGPTVYDYPHVGNWSSYIYWDILVRTLLADGYNVTRVINITDVGHLTSDADEGEDKLEKGARRENKTAQQIASYYTDVFLAGMKQLNLVPPQIIAKATDFIPQQLELIRNLRQKGYTYQISDGIYFDTSKFTTYANFAHLDLDELKAGARVEYNQEKHSPSDFALWKFTPVGKTRDMQWPTPDDLLDNGDNLMGFPGWHLECSAIIAATLDKTIDIHTGGIDHIPIHHTNEIAQSEAANGVKLSNYWLHNNHLKVNGTKISKSLGNGYTLDELKGKGFSMSDFRMFVLQGNYKHEGNFTFENLVAAKNRLRNWQNVAVIRHQIHSRLETDQDKLKNPKIIYSYVATKALVEALNNDLNTAEALKIIDESFSKIISTHLDNIDRNSLLELLETIDSTLGFQLLATTPDISDETKQLIIARSNARATKDWEKSDELRDKLAAQGIVIKDTSHGTIWQYQ